MDFSLHANSKIYIAGHNGLIGSAFLKYFRNNNYNNIIYKKRSELDLCSREDTYNFFKENNPEVVILAAGKVGGIIQNRDFPADFITENLSIQLNVIGAANKFHVKKLIFFGSSCMYPKDTNQPMKESQLWTGHLEETSIAYASAKYAGLQMCQAINLQTNSPSFITVIPNSVYGPNDNFDLSSSHVLSALIRRIHEAKMNNSSSVLLLGTGSPKREFIYSDDLVRACIVLLNSSLNYDKFPINISEGIDFSIKDLSYMISRIIGFKGKISWDSSKPDGVARKLLDNSKIKSYGWSPSISLEDGINRVYKWYLESNI